MYMACACVYVRDVHVHVPAWHVRAFTYVVCACVYVRDVHVYVRVWCVCTYVCGVCVAYACMWRVRAVSCMAHITG